MNSMVKELCGVHMRVVLTLQRSSSVRIIFSLNSFVCNSIEKSLHRNFISLSLDLNILLIEKTMSNLGTCRRTN